MISFLTSRLGLAAIAVVVALAAIVAVYEEGRDAGESAVEADGLRTTIETQRRIDDADAHGPRTPDDVDQRLRNGKF